MLLCTKFHQNRIIFVEIWGSYDFKDGGRPTSFIFEIWSLCKWTCITMSFCFSKQNFTEIGKYGAELWPKRFAIRRTSAILNSSGPRMGSLKSPCRTSYWSSIETVALNCLKCLDRHIVVQYADTQDLPITSK